MCQGEKNTKITTLRAEFDRLLQFHSDSFKEIDEKAKYWLTVSLPSFLAVLGYSFENFGKLSVYFLSAFSAVGVCLLASIYFFSSALRSMHVEGGILAPNSRDFADTAYFLQSSEKWTELLEDQTKETLRAIAQNERQNSYKSASLGKGEVSLFRGVPISACLAAGCAFAYTTSSPSGLATAGIVHGAPAIATISGIAVGATTIAVLVVTRHFSTLRRS